MLGSSSGPQHREKPPLGLFSDGSRTDTHTQQSAEWNRKSPVKVKGERGAGAALRVANVRCAEIFNDKPSRSSLPLPFRTDYKRRDILDVFAAERQVGHGRMGQEQK